MARLVPFIVLAVSLALAWPASCKPLPVLVPVTKDPATLLYTLPFHYGADLVVDTAGPLVWSTCQRGHLPADFPCNSATCRLANAFHAPGCRARGCGRDKRRGKTCTAYPYNPVTGACAAGDLVHTRFVANTTDGVHPVSQVNVRALAACAPSRLLKSLPRGASGVAGLAGSGLALPAQVASVQNLPNKFLLCLPRGGSSGNTGAAIFGGGPFQVSAQPGRDFTQELVYTPLVAAKKGMPPAHYVSVESVAVENTHVAAAGDAVVCTRVPFTLLRQDVYRPFVSAFSKALTAQGAQGGPVARPVKAVAPFELCYDARSLANTRIGYLVPGVTLTLGGGKNWTMNGLSSMVDIKPGTACLAFVRMAGVKASDRSAPAVLVGGFQMENTVVEFDMANKRLGFVRLPFFTQCGHFNFTQTG